MTPDDPRATPPEIDEDAIRAWTRNQVRAHRAYNAREAELDDMCTNCHERPREHRRTRCWKCRHIDTNERSDR